MGQRFGALSRSWGGRGIACVVLSLREFRRERVSVLAEQPEAALGARLGRVEARPTTESAAFDEMAFEDTDIGLETVDCASSTADCHRCWGLPSERRLGRSLIVTSEACSQPEWGARVREKRGRQIVAMHSTDISLPSVWHGQSRRQIHPHKYKTLWQMKYPAAFHQ